MKPIFCRLTLVFFIIFALPACSRAERLRAEAVDAALTADAAERAAKPAPSPTPKISLDTLGISFKDDISLYAEIYLDPVPEEVSPSAGALQVYAYCIARVSNDGYFLVTLQEFGDDAQAADANAAGRDAALHARGRELAITDTVSLPENAWMMFLPGDKAILLGYSSGAATAQIRHFRDWNESVDLLRPLTTYLAQEQYFKLFQAGYR